MNVTTTKGDMDTALLEKAEGVVDDEREYTTWVEYRLGGELVHRSVHVRLKKGLADLLAEAQILGGH